MVNDQITSARLQNYLNQYEAKYPGVWRTIDDFRQDRGIELPAWPDWCWCPLSGAYAIISAHIKQPRLTLEYIADVAPLGALAAWRMTRGVYRYDSDLFRALWNTPLEGNLPVEILYRLPEWCVYVQVPADTDCFWFGTRVRGWFAHLEWDVNVNRPELRFLFDAIEPDRLIAFPLHLDYHQLQDCVLAALEVARNNWVTEGPEPETVLQEFVRHISPFLSVTLYLCAESPDIVDLHGRKLKPANPLPEKTKSGQRIFPAGNNTAWQVGYRIGAALRRVYAPDASSEVEAAGTPDEKQKHASPRPHIRRAHWHAYWTGPRQGQRQTILKWLPPVPIGAGEIISTIHPVKNH
jgi:hypothetical protein